MGEGGCGAGPRAEHFPPPAGVVGALGPFAPQTELGLGLHTLRRLLSHPPSREVGSDRSCSSMWSWAQSTGPILLLLTPALLALPADQGGQAPPAGSHCPWHHSAQTSPLLPIPTLGLGSKEQVLSGTLAPGSRLVTT